MARRSLAALVVLAVLLTIGTASGSQVRPPGPTGCADGLTRSTTDPSARLPARAVLRPSTAHVRMLVTRATQTTRVTLSAYRLTGRRADAMRPGGYTCTVPGALITVAFPVRAGVVSAAIRRHGSVRLRVRFQMVNANGRSTTLRRTITVTRER